MLGIGRIIHKPWVVNGELAVRTVSKLTLTFDHRVGDGGTAGGSCSTSPMRLRTWARRSWTCEVGRDARAGWVIKPCNLGPRLPMYLRRMGCLTSPKYEPDVMSCRPRASLWHSRASTGPECTANDWVT
ncbi:2-oxo acid dehydrogenase subunit E2 [Arthrobacter sp. 2MCAF15]